jgi:hypothetical protein
MHIKEWFGWYKIEFKKTKVRLVHPRLVEYILEMYSTSLEYTSFNLRNVHTYR